MTFNLTDNEMAAALILVGECLNGMGGSRPADLENDEFTWCSADSLVAAGWSKESAAGTFSSLDAKGMIFEADKNQMAMTTEGWRYLDHFWDQYNELVTKGKSAPVTKPAAKTQILTKKELVRGLLTGSGTTIFELSEILGITEVAARSLIADLRRDGYKVMLVGKARYRI